jgi:hypothetical protein
MLRACENMLRRILGLLDEARGERMRQHADELHDLYSKNIIRVIK